jgi:hypothetical protein
MIVIVPATTATGVTRNNHVVVPLDVDVVNAGVADIVGTHIGLAVVDLRRLPCATATLGAGAIAPTAPSATATATTCAGAATAATTSTPVAPSGCLSEGGHGETRQYDGGEGSQKQSAE